MWKSIIAGTAALAIAGSSLVYAQHVGGPRSRPSAEDLRAFGEARLAGLKAGLNMTPEQEKNWPVFEQAARLQQASDRTSNGHAQRGSQQ